MIQLHNKKYIFAVTLFPPIPLRANKNKIGNKQKNQKMIYW